MSFRALASSAVVALVVATGCSKADVSMQNDLRGTSPVVAKGGVPDDSVKPKTLVPVVGKNGVPDDGVKPAPAPLPLPARGGVPDDSVKTGPRPAPPKP